MPGTSPGMTEKDLRRTVNPVSLQLRLVARLDFGLRLRVAQPGLVVDHLADAWKYSALNLCVGRPQFRAHQRLAAMEIGLLHADAQHRARRLAEFLHRGQQMRLRRELAGAADAQRLVDAGHEEDQLHEARTLDDILEAVDPVVAG